MAENERLLTQEQEKQAAHVYQLVVRQAEYGVPGDLAVAVLASAAGATAAHFGWTRERLANLLAVMEKGFDGHRKGSAARDTETRGR